MKIILKRQYKSTGHYLFHNIQTHINIYRLFQKMWPTRLLMPKDVIEICVLKIVHTHTHKKG